MGIIYRITSPNGKKYIGQTIKTFEHRMNAHFNAATRGDDLKSCRCINRAIRKYGWENMVKEIILECDNDELNNNEIAKISEENSLYPNGYNLCKGGAGCVYIQTDEIKEKRSKSLRSRDDTIDLPMYVKFRKTKYSEGFIYEKPGEKSVQFTSPKMSMEEKKNAVLEFIEKKKENPDIVVDLKRKKQFDFEMVKYISYQQRINGFIVNKPGFPRKSFARKTLSDEQKYQLAKEYLDQLV